MNNLADLYEKQGKFDQGERLYVECIVKKKLALGPDHPDTLASMNGLANLYSLKSDHKKAGKPTQ